MDTARQALDQIDIWLSANPQNGGLPSNEAQDLWDVLAALRGPDVPSYPDKDVTTAPIRGAAFPKLLKNSKDWSSLGVQEELFTRQGMSIAPAEKFVSPDSDIFTHFLSHIRTAAKALGLK